MKSYESEQFYDEEEQFNDEERIIINSFTTFYDINAITKEQFCSELTFMRDIQTDEAMANLITGILDKFSAMTNDKWDHFRGYPPLPTNYEPEYANLEEAI